MKTEAEKYDCNNALQVRDAKLLIERIKLEFPEYDSRSATQQEERQLIMLDIGCGSGNVTELLATAFKPKRLIAIDSSESMIQYAKKHHSRPEIDYFVADCTGNSKKLSELLAIVPGTVDLVLSIYCLHWVANIGDALHNVHTFLRPKVGRFALITSVWSDILPVQHRIIDNPAWKTKLQQWIEERSRRMQNKEQLNNSQVAVFGIQNKPELSLLDARWRYLTNKFGLEIDNLTFSNVNIDFNNLKSFHNQVEIVSYWFDIVPQAFQDQFRHDYFRLIDQEYVKPRRKLFTSSIKFNYTYAIVTGTNTESL